MADIWFFVGALIPTFLLSRIALWLLKRWNGGYARLVAAHVLSLAVATLIGAFGMADGGPLAFGVAFLSYVGPQLLWMALDGWRLHRKLPEARPPEPATSDPSA